MGRSRRRSPLGVRGPWLGWLWLGWLWLAVGGCWSGRSEPSPPVAGGASPQSATPGSVEAPGHGDPGKGSPGEGSPTVEPSGERRTPSVGPAPVGPAPEPDQSDTLDDFLDEKRIESGEGIEVVVTRELDALRVVLGFPRGLLFVLVVALAWVISRAITRAARFALRLGFQRRRLITTAGALLSMATWGGAFVFVAYRLLLAAPMLALGGLGLLAVTLVMVVRRQVENLAAGVTLAVRSRLREGDRIALGEYQGVVRRVGFTRVELHQADGSRLYLPNRLVGTEAVVIGLARYSVPLQISLGRDRPWGAEEIRRARRLAELSPYRDPSGRVVVQAEEGAEHRLSVQFQVWSPRLHAAAEEHLRRQLDRHVAHRSGLKRGGDRRQGERRLHERRGL